MGLIREIDTYLSSKVPGATVRYGDYPRGKNSLEISLILSELGDVEKVWDYFTRATKVMSYLKKRENQPPDRQREINISVEHIPSLLK